MAKERDYKKEVQQRKIRQQAKVDRNIAEQLPPPSKKAMPDKKKVLSKNPASNKQDDHEITYMPADCGHMPVQLSQIVSDPNQPRKFFDAQKMLELRDSIIKHDVIEPILIRPIAGGLYMVVFGERRFRASLMAGETGHGITHIPAMIRELTDHEALELQLVENLHRTDPHPIEDAHTFKKMLETHPIEEIALRIGKSEKFVAMRIMLTDLIQPFQDIFFAEKMSLGQAVMLCKVSAESQAAIFTDEVPADWKENKGYMLDDISRLVNRESKNLDSAPFNTEDAELYPEMGACNKCQYNSANTLQLFVEEQTVRICGNAVCYNIKCSRDYKQTIESVMVNPSVVFVAAFHYDEASKQKVKEVEKLNVPVLKAGSWQKLEMPSLPDAQEGTEEDIELYNDECKVIEQARKDGKVKKAFIVAGNGQGTMIEIIENESSPELNMADGTGCDPSIAKQIAEINQREERKKEIDAEHIWTEIREQMLVGDHFTKDSILLFTETNALAVAIYESLDYQRKQVFTTDVLKVMGGNQMEIAAAFQNITTAQLNMLYRALIGSKIFPATGSHTKNYVNAAGFALAKVVIPSTVTNIESEVNIKAEKRAQKVKKAIADLQEPKE